MQSRGGSETVIVSDISIVAARACGCCEPPDNSYFFNTSDLGRWARGQNKGRGPGCRSNSHTRGVAALSAETHARTDGRTHARTHARAASGFSAVFFSVYAVAAASAASSSESPRPRVPAGPPPALPALLASLRALRMSSSVTFRARQSGQCLVLDWQLSVPVPECVFLTPHDLVLAPRPAPFQLPITLLERRRVRIGCFKGHI